MKKLTFSNKSDRWFAGVGNRVISAACPKAVLLVVLEPTAIKRSITTNGLDKHGDTDMIVLHNIAGLYLKQCNNKVNQKSQIFSFTHQK